MPRVIADSDDESDLNSPLKQRVAPENVVGNAAPSQASLSGYDFDQYYLDPTQRLSSLSPTQQRPDMRLRSSVSGIDGTSEAVDGPATRLKKRPHSALHNTSNDLQGNSGLTEPTSKKSKVYGHASKSRTVHDIDLFTGVGKTSVELQNANSTIPDKIASGQPRSDLSRDTNATIGSLSTDLTLPSGVLSLIDQSTTDASHRLTTSVASIGRYEFLNLDFRGSGQGLDVHANPFGSLSQVSLDEDPNPTETERFASMFRASKDLPQEDYTDQNPASLKEALRDPFSPDLLQVEPDRATTVHPSRLIQHDGALPDPVVDRHGPASEVTMGAPDLPVRSEVALSDPGKPPPEKRGRKPKNSRLSSKSPAPGVLEDADMDELALPHLPPLGRSRRGTMDSLSQASQTSATAASSRKRKRGKSSEVVEGQQREEEDQAAESSPRKQPTSELHLSDEALIGLPKEQYKPRPSRSRSKRIVDEEEEDSFLPPPIPEAKHDAIAAAAIADIAGPQEQPPVITPAKAGAKKPGRKSKVKRAKTSAAALLKKPDPMLSEGEDDVVWMDSKPAPVKLNLPPDIKGLKKEADILKDDKQEAKENDEAEATMAKGGDGKIIIEIPLAAEVKDPVAGPKKRGRKPKKPPQKEETQAVDEESQNDLTRRPALAEKTPNVPSRDVNGYEPRPPTVSPISVCALQPPSASPEKENNPPTDSALTTPAKQTTGKGPTKHSPITALNLSSGMKVTYRVGLSRRQHIPSLLRKVQRDKPLPKVVVRKEPKSKKDVVIDCDGDGDREGRSCLATSELRGEDGMLIEWGD